MENWTLKNSHLCLTLYLPLQKMTGSWKWFLGSIKDPSKVQRTPLFRDQQLFSLLDRDEDGFIDFRAILVFLFSTEVSLSPEDARLRSFRFYDRSASELLSQQFKVKVWNWVFRLGNKVITKMEMLRTLVLLGHIQVKITLLLCCPLHHNNLRLTWQC